ncbi:23S rRNA (adenine(2030)-N(6))-methyltransferase RlmJ [Pelagovum pacificum]|uniref:Ribosomal RNA large subunit methyltransferase J n=1 Tax=Pelagovum pacificum TaxID=2588711 RepID=A0A5C5GDG7_9RHOB|nr:23S rRNA (adenine(2030)-N(6))-methyltransferase RlmJ [Pelagovum pacificum]QQA44088.1 23S rRNA (adenine(2030)-N(6))-methyltransferase RlmJ [Pelagovum pacificum]TNY32783.1 23S rRNA (adenine(2030)-N(6))-methyltransferase RlmJ [Pelagovum pacificum]
MLSYQHAYHAGNMADLHKHSVLAVALDYLVQKPKPLTYIETHAGRGLYDLAGPEAARTGEAARGIGTQALPDGHPLGRVLDAVRARHGRDAYAGSPLIATGLLRDEDRMHLAELHPQEHDALARVMRQQTPRPKVYRQDGAKLAMSLAPPDPRRGLCLIDPSWEVKSDYQEMPRLLAKLHRAWSVGVLILWYPVLTSGAHRPMLRAIGDALPEAEIHEIGFPPAREGHGMVGSGLVLINPPFGLKGELERLSSLFPPGPDRPN